MIKKLRGVVHGRTVQLEEDPGIPDGESVEVIYSSSVRTGEGILRTAGMLADDLEWDQIMEEIYLERKGIYRQNRDDK